MGAIRFDLGGEAHVAIVTAAGEALGASHARLLAARGCRVLACRLGGRGGSSLDELVAEIASHGGQAEASRDDDAAAIVAQALARWRRLDVLVLDGGAIAAGPFEVASNDARDDFTERAASLRALTRAAWAALGERGGRVVVTSSVAAVHGGERVTTEAFASGSLLGWARALADEGRARGILVNGIVPVVGDRLTAEDGDGTDALAPEHVSPLVALLAHPEHRSSGELFEVGGGLIATLRWERSTGKRWKLGRTISPEMVQAAWPSIAFADAGTHPATRKGALAPILENRGSQSLGGNAFIDVDEALGHAFPPRSSSYDERDLVLYALGVGAGGASSHATSGLPDLQYLYESAPTGFRALPTFAVVPALNLVLGMASEGTRAPGLNYGFDRILHDEQFTELARPLPTRATLTHHARIKDIFDLGRHARVVTAIESYDETGALLATNEVSTLVRGAGGWGGPKGPERAEPRLPPGAPDAEEEEATTPAQALLYRLSGDINPLHADPAFARRFGFARPILHGLCTFGIVGRHVLRAFCGNDPRRLKSLRARFQESVFPGETLVTSMWREGATRILVRCTAKERGVVVLSGAVAELVAENDASTNDRPLPASPPINQ